MDFSYSENEVKDCILETERQLHDAIFSIMRCIYGSSWEQDAKSGWSNSKRADLAGKMEKRRKEFPYARNSTRLIDYAYISDIKLIIQAHEPDFKDIFPEWSRTMMYFDILGRLRNIAMHPHELTRHQCHLCLGICGELLSSLEHWSKGYSRRIEFCQSDLAFDEPDNGNPIAAKKLALESAERWLQRVRDISLSPVRTVPDQEFGNVDIITLKQGEAKISHPFAATSNLPSGHHQTACIRITSQVFDALCQVLDLDLQPYWVLRWHLAGDIDVPPMIDNIAKIRGTWPLSGSLISPGVYGSSHFYITRDEERSVRVDIGQGEAKTMLLTLVFDGRREANTGFTKAHRVFDPDKILAILYGEIDNVQTRRLVLNSLSS